MHVTGRKTEPVEIEISRTGAIRAAYRDWLLTLHHYTNLTIHDGYVCWINYPNTDFATYEKVRKATSTEVEIHNAFTLLLREVTD